MFARTHITHSSDLLSRLQNCAGAPADFQHILLVAQTPRQLESLLQSSQGLVEVAEPCRLSTVGVVHQAVDRLIELRSSGQHTLQQSLIRVQPVSLGHSGIKRSAVSRDRGDGVPYLKNVTFGGRGNFLPVNAPVIFKRSLITSQERDSSDGNVTVLAKFKVEEVRLVSRKQGTSRTIPVSGVECHFPKAGPTAKPTLVFTAREMHGLRPGCSCITMQGKGGQMFTAPVDTVSSASTLQFTVKGYLTRAEAINVADYLNGKSTSGNACIREEYHVQNNEPFLYCVTLLRDTNSCPAQIAPAQPVQLPTLLQSEDSQLPVLLESYLHVLPDENPVLDNGQAAAICRANYGTLIGRSDAYEGIRSASASNSQSNSSQGYYSRVGGNLHREYSCGSGHTGPGFVHSPLSGFTVISAGRAGPKRKLNTCP